MNVYTLNIIIFKYEYIFLLQELQSLVDIVLHNTTGKSQIDMIVRVLFAFMYVCKCKYSASLCTILF